MSIIMPCPFCGADSIKVVHQQRKFKGENELGWKIIRMKYFCYCNKCRASGPPVFDDIECYGSPQATDNAKNEERAIKKWNNRRWR